MHSYSLLCGTMEHTNIVRYLDFLAGPDIAVEVRSEMAMKSSTFHRHVVSRYWYPVGDGGAAGP